MADLLECLVQVRALAGTPGRLAALLARCDEASWRRRDAATGTSPLERLVALAEAELLFAAAIRLVLVEEEAALPRWQAAALLRRSGVPGWGPTDAIERFRARRADNVELLASCSAAELGRQGRHPERGPVSIADLVALALAADTETVGAIRDALDAGRPAGQGGTP